MKSTRIEVADQVAKFLRSLAPEPRRGLKLAIKGLAESKGDVKTLSGELSGFSRLRVGRYRVIFRSLVENGVQLIRCDYADDRAVVYDRFRAE